LAAERYPEIAFENQFVAHDGQAREVWVCQAPSKAHLQRWARAAHLTVRALEHVDIRTLPGRPRHGRPVSSTEGIGP
jgi:hypothetical protein